MRAIPASIFDAREYYWGARWLETVTQRLGGPQIFLGAVPHSDLISVQSESGRLLEVVPEIVPVPLNAETGRHLIAQLLDPLAPRGA